MYFSILSMTRNHQNELEGLQHKIMAANCDDAMIYTENAFSTNAPAREKTSAIARCSLSGADHAVTLFDSLGNSLGSFSNVHDSKPSGLPCMFEVDAK